MRIANPFIRDPHAPNREEKRKDCEERESETPRRGEKRED